MVVTGICDNECANLAKILQAAYPIIEYIIQTEDGQTGGVLCIADAAGNPHLLAVFGTMTPHERDEYIFYAQEKPRRIAAHAGHYSSWQSRDLNAKPPQYAGAIRVGSTILSFSGFKEEQDEAAMLVLAMNANLMVGGPAALIAQMSRNEYFRKLQNACGTDSAIVNSLDRYRIVD